MISKINIEEFRERLNKNTKFGNPKIMGTPFSIFSIAGESNKSFLGTYSKAKFELTKNSVFFSTPYILSGEINAKDNNQTQIIYEVKPIGFGYYWLKYIPIIGILLFNLILYTQSESIEVFLLVNSFTFCIAIFSYLYMWRKKSKLVTDFNKVFEIESE